MHCFAGVSGLKRLKAGPLLVNDDLSPGFSDIFNMSIFLTGSFPEGIKKAELLFKTSNVIYWLPCPGPVVTQVDNW